MDQEENLLLTVKCLAREMEEEKVRSNPSTSRHISTRTRSATKARETNESNNNQGSNSKYLPRGCYVQLANITEKSETKDAFLEQTMTDNELFEQDTVMIEAILEEVEKAYDCSEHDTTDSVLVDDDNVINEEAFLGEDLAITISDEEVNKADTEQKNSTEPVGRLKRKRESDYLDGTRSEPSKRKCNEDAFTTHAITDLDTPVPSREDHGICDDVIEVCEEVDHNSVAGQNEEQEGKKEAWADSMATAHHQSPSEEQAHPRFHQSSSEEPDHLRIHRILSEEPARPRFHQSLSEEPAHPRVHQSPSEEPAHLKSNFIEISSDEDDDDDIEYIEQDLEQLNNQNIEEADENERDLVIDEGEDVPTFPQDNIKYSFVYIELETMLGSNSNCKEITQIGGFRKNPISNEEEPFFKAIEPKKLTQYLEGYKLGGDLLQTLNMQKNDSGKYEFRKPFEIMEEGRVAIKCVDESKALEELSVYLAGSENCIIVSLSEENIKLLVQRMKILNASNKKIHLDKVKGCCTWSAYLKENNSSEEDLNKDFEDWYSDYMFDSSSSQGPKKHANVVANMVHDAVNATQSFMGFHPDISSHLVKASRSINSLQLDMASEEVTDSEIQYLEIFCSLRPDLPALVTLTKLESYDICSEDEDEDTENKNHRDSVVKIFKKLNEERKRKKKLDLKLVLRNQRKKREKTEEIKKLKKEEKSKKNLHKVGIETGVPTSTGGDGDEWVEAGWSGLPTNPGQSGTCAPTRMGCWGGLPTPVSAIAPPTTRIPAEVPLPTPVPARALLTTPVPARVSVVTPMPPIASVAPMPARAVVATQSERHLIFPEYQMEDGEILECPICLKCFSSEAGRTQHTMAKHPTADMIQSEIRRLELLTCPICSKRFNMEFGRNQHIIAKHNPNAMDQSPFLPLELQCNKCYVWMISLEMKLKHQCKSNYAKIPLFLQCQRCRKSFKSFEEKTGHIQNCKTEAATSDEPLFLYQNCAAPKTVPNGAKYMPRLPSPGYHPARRGFPGPNFPQNGR